jgi:hypothetical protein
MFLYRDAITLLSALLLLLLLNKLNWIELLLIVTKLYLLIIYYNCISSVIKMIIVCYKYECVYIPTYMYCGVFAQSKYCGGRETAVDR